MSEVINAESLMIKPLHQVLPILTAMINLQFNNIGAIPGLFGDAGIGKTANIKKLCAANNWNLLDIHYGLKPLEEISGLPDFGETTEVEGQQIKCTNWTLPDILGDAYKLSKNGQPTVIFLDDFHTASPGNMALGYEMFTSKKLRGYPFPPNTAFVLAANVSGAKSLANPIPAPIMNRISMFKVGIDFDQWKRDFAIPNKINSKILAFLSNPKYKKFFQTTEIVNKPWGSARAWTNLSAIFNPIEQYSPQTLNTLGVNYIASSFVDQEAALNFAKYYILFGEINTKDLFDGISNVDIPDDMQKKYVYILACLDEFISRFSRSDKDEDKSKYVEILARVIVKIAQTNSEIAVVGMKELIIFQNALKIKVFSEVDRQIKLIDSNIAARIVNDIRALV